MAQAKAQTTRSRQQKTARKRSNSGGAKPRAASANRSGGKPSTSQGAKSRRPSPNGPTARRTRRSRASTPSANGHGATGSIKNTAESVKDTVTSGAGTVAEAAQKAKAPLIAGGATIAGVAGAIALASRSSGGPKVLGVRVGRRNGFKLPGRRGGLKRDARKLTSAITEAAGRADRFGRNVSKVASTIRQVSETADDAAKKA